MPSVDGPSVGEKLGPPPPLAQGPGPVLSSAHCHPARTGTGATLALPVCCRPLLCVDWPVAVVKVSKHLLGWGTFDNPEV